MKNNDQRILEMKKQIEMKKKELGASTPFNPITNCSLELDGLRYNLHAFSKDGLMCLLIKLNSYALSAKDLGLLENYIISGFHISDWIKDMKSKLAFLNRKDEDIKLKAMEQKLDKLLSEEKKTELEIDEIESFLK